jgi:acetylornithine deacetylase/succinyl-diaminopimelate desuccinylase-like protein
MSVGMAESVQGYLDAHRDTYNQEFLDLLRIPSVSTTPEHAGDVRRGAEWVMERLKRAGVPKVELIETAGHPVVFGTWHAALGKPTILVYGHYDVQPADPLNLWKSPAFEPTMRDGRIYARGSADMKSNLVTLIQAVEALAAVHGAPPVNLTFFWEGEEEIGSPHALEAIEANKDRLKADAVLSCDGGMEGPNTASLNVSLKGMTGLQIDLRTSSTDLHSGMYGATVPNALQALAKLAYSFHDADGRVAIQGFYDDVVELSPHERAELAAHPQSEAELLEEAGVSAAWGEPGYSAKERQGARPTIDFNGIWGGFQGEGTKTVTPAEAHLKVTSRLVPNQDPAKISDLIKKHALAYAPEGATVTFSNVEHGAPAYAVPRDNPLQATAERVLTEQYGSKPVIERSGGSVPITATFKAVLGLDTVTIGFGLPGSNVHAPNEWFREEDLDRARKVYAAYLSAF